MNKQYEYKKCPKCGQMRFQHQNTSPGWTVNSSISFKVVPFETWQCTNCQHIERWAGDQRAVGYTAKAVIQDEHRKALERIVVESSDEYSQEIAREALRDE